jgi:DNA (cytosine-5)-methyltransferase 1
LFSFIPGKKLDSVINKFIGEDHNIEIQKQIDDNLNGEKVDLIIGGPPCQAYSLVGRSRSKTNMIGDPRNFLFTQYVKYLEKYRPKAFVFENVLGLKSANGGEYLKQMQKLFEKKNYAIKLFTLEAKNFGVLQNRKRIIIIGFDSSSIDPLPQLDQIKVRHDFKVEDLLSDLPKIQAGQGKNKFLKYSSKPTDYLDAFSIRNGIDVLTQHVARPNNDQDKEIYRIAVQKWINSGERLNYNDLPERLKTHNNRNSFIDRFKIVAPELPFSQTIVAHIAKDGHHFIHPNLKQNRSISVREAARLQSFPDDYYFEGIKENSNRTSAFKQIGNAVPPLMAKMIAENIKSIL